MKTKNYHKKNVFKNNIYTKIISTIKFKTQEIY